MRPTALPRAVALLSTAAALGGGKVGALAHGIGRMKGVGATPAHAAR
jgi:hypothetical protein